MKHFLNNNFNDVQLLILVQSLRTLSSNLSTNSPSIPFIEDDDQEPSLIIESIINFYQGMKSQGRGHRLLQVLENRVIRDGFLKNQLQLKVHEDVFPSLRDWKAQGILVYLDCPLMSSEDVLLIISKTTKGDLSQLIDKVVGNDKEFLTSDSTKSYSHVIDSLGVKKLDLLFITQYGQRAKQMHEGLHINCLVVDRAENRKLRSYYIIRFPCVKDLREVQFVQRKESTK